MTISGEIAAAHWESLELLLPGRSVGLYLVGSAALGDFQPTSDVDTFTVLKAPLDRVDQQLLRGVHDDVHAAFPDVRYDTVYVPKAWLAAPPWPGPSPSVPFSLDGHLVLGEASGEIHPINWMFLERGIRIAGPAIRDLQLRIDEPAARAYVVHHLQTYWAGVAAELALATRRMKRWQDLREPDVIAWTVLGVPRLTAFLETGTLISKTAAGDYLATKFPEYANLARRCVAFRRGERQVFMTADVRATIEVVRRLVSEGGAQYPPAPEAANG